MWDLIELRFMMGKPSRKPNYTNSPKIQGKTHNTRCIVHSPTSSLCAQRLLPLLPVLSSSLSPIASSTDTQHTYINHVQLFKVLDLELDSLTLQQQSDNTIGDSWTSFPSLSKLSIPPSPILHSFFSFYSTPIEQENGAQRRAHMWL